MQPILFTAYFLFFVVKISDFRESFYQCNKLNGNNLEKKLVFPDKLLFSVLFSVKYNSLSRENL